MTNTHFNTASLVKTFATLVVLAIIAWNMPFLATAEGEVAGSDTSVAAESASPEVSSDTAAASASFSVSCAGSPNPGVTGEPVTWSANVTPSSGAYTYSWTGDGNFPGNQTTKTVTATYPNQGKKIATVTVALNGAEKSATCNVQIAPALPPGEPLTASCVGTPAMVGEPVTWTATGNGGNGTYQYAWTGDGNFPPNQTTKVVTATYPNQGVKEAHVKITSAGEDVTADCSTTVTATPPPPPPSCDRVADLAGSITESVVNGKVVATIHNNSQTCSYDVGLASYKKLTLGLPHQGGVQELYDSEMHTEDNKVGPGETRTLSVDVPTCNFQTDLFAGPYPSETGSYQDSIYHLFDAYHDNSRGSCTTEEPPLPGVCVPNRAAHLSATEITIDAQGRAISRVTNSSSNCSYNVTLVSYKTGVWDHGFTLEERREWLLNQEVFDSHVHPALGPGQFVDLVVDIPSCDYQADVLQWNNGADSIPDNGLVIDDGHGDEYWLLEFDVTPNGGSCFDIPQCPAQPTITSIIPANTNLAIGAPFNYTVTTTGGTPPISVSINAVGTPAPGLTVNGSTISGTVTTTGTYTYEVTAKSVNSPLSCAAKQTFTITVHDITNQCPAAPTITSVPPVATNVAPGTNYSYTVTTSGGVAPVAVTITPVNAAPGLTINGNTLSGTLTTSGTYSYRVSALSSGSPSNLDCDVEQIINISVATIVDECPASAIPTITSIPPVTTNVDTGTNYNYTVTTSGGEAPIIVNITAVNAAPGLSVDGNTLSGTFTEEGSFSYTVTARSTGRPLSCAATQTITMSVDNGGGGCTSNCNNDDDDDDNGGGGRRRRPNVVLFSEPEILGASVSLTQVPYTGVGSSIFQIVLFMLGLIAISGGIVYAIMRKLRRADLAAGTMTMYGGTSARAAVAPVDDSYEMLANELPISAYEEYVEAPVAQPRRMPEPRMQPAFATAPVVSREPVYTSRTAEAPAALEKVSMPMAQQPSRPQHSVAGEREMTVAPSDRAPQVNVDPSRLQVEARASRTLISDDGAQLIAHSAEGDEKRALERLSQVVEIAKTRYPREDGWLILDKDRVRESLFISTLSMIPLFVEWMVRGEDKKVFTFLRMLKHQEQPVADFMRKVVSELDTAHRARLEGAEEHASMNPHIAEVTYHLSNKELESIVAELLHGVDERYDSPYTSVRLSLVRVLDMIKERMLRSVGSAYAFKEEERRA